MSGGVDISASAVMKLDRDLRTISYSAEQGCAMRENAAATLRALRAALDAAERERDEARIDCDGLGHHVAILLQQYLDAMNARDTADATGYARGVRDAAGEDGCRIRCDECVREKRRCLREAAILALLPDATKEKNDAE